MPDAPPKTGGLLALDLARVTGWAYLAPGGQPVFGSREFGEGGIEIGVLAHKFDLWLSDKITAFKPALVAYEMHAGRWFDNRAPLVCYGMIWHAEEICWRRGVATVHYSNSEWTKTFLGTAKRHGSRAGKRKGKDARRVDFKSRTQVEAKLRGWPVRNPDQADALGILVHAAKVSGIAPELAERGTLLELET
jgi:hypothetical protein